MSAGPEIVRTIADLRMCTGDWRARGLSGALVPTMGALHDGHLALVDLARNQADKVVVSIFVNPTQFAPHEDLKTYPRSEADDIARLSEHEADLVYIPDVETMYPKGFATEVKVAGLTHGLCSATRPHFFGGVATVVAKLLIQAQCGVAVFGEKDYQQLLVVRQLARDLDIPTEIIAAPIVRESDGLAMSSRNRRLSPDERKRAPMLHRTLVETAARIVDGETAKPALEQARHDLAQAGFEVDYVELCDAETLEPIDTASAGNARLLAATYIGTTRLIDNVAL